jgi:hypothetical protein
MRDAIEPALRAALALACLWPLCCGGRSGQGGDPDAGAATPVSCNEVCEHVQAVSCGDSTNSCVDTCDAVAQLPTSRACRDEAGAQRSCRLNLPAENFLCADGVPVAGGPCDTRDAAFLACLSLRRGDYGACERACEVDVALGCSNATDAARCRENCSNVSRLGACSDEALVWYQCVAKLPPEELRCQDDILAAADGACDEPLALFAACRP